METAIHSSAKILHEQTEKIILQELSTQQNVGGSHRHPKAQLDKRIAS